MSALDDIVAQLLPKPAAQQPAMGAMMATPQTPEDAAAMQPETFANPAVAHVLGSLASLPRRAIEGSAADLATMGTGAPMQSIAPAVETAMTMMGGAGVVPAEANTLRMGIKAYHGSPISDLSKVLANPPARQFDNATSQFGAYFAPDAKSAERYAGSGGRVYSADVPIEKPYEMPWSEFNYFQSPNKGPNGESLAGEHWANRAEELKAEAAVLKTKLQAEGHDGMIVRKSNGDPYEIAAFGDVPLTKDASQ